MIKIIYYYDQPIDTRPANWLELVDLVDCNEYIIAIYRRIV